MINMVLGTRGVGILGTCTMYLCGEKSPYVVWVDHIDVDFYPCIDTPDNTVSLLCFLP